MELELYIGNDNLLSLVGLQNKADASYLNAATVTVTLVDSDGVDVTGESWPVTLSYIPTTNGNYRATLSDTLSGLTDGDSLTAKLTADAGAGLKGYWEIPVTAKTRTS